MVLKKIKIFLNYDEVIMCLYVCGLIVICVNELFYSRIPIHRGCLEDKEGNTKTSNLKRGEIFNFQNQSPLPRILVAQNHTTTRFAFHNGQAKNHGVQSNRLVWQPLVHQ